jgi:hypothetical protein
MAGDRCFVAKVVDALQEIIQTGCLWERIRLMRRDPYGLHVSLERPESTRLGKVKP